MLVRTANNAAVKAGATVSPNGTKTKYKVVGWNNGKVVVRGPSGKQYKHDPQDYGLRFA